MIVNREYSLLLVRNEIIEKCRNCLLDENCCTADCELFDRAVEAKEEGFLNVDICKYCPSYEITCLGWDSKHLNLNI